jgi:hypothetical protein
MQCGSICFGYLSPLLQREHEMPPYNEGDQGPHGENNYGLRQVRKSVQEKMEAVGMQSRVEIEQQRWIDPAPLRLCIVVVIERERAS